MKSIYILLWIALTSSIQSQSIVMLEDQHLLIELTVEEHASMFDQKWFYFSITNKSHERLRFDRLDYSINTFEEDAYGNSTFNKSAFGSGNKYDLFHHFHSSTNVSESEQSFFISPGEQIHCWKVPVSKAGIAIENSLVRSEELCALMEINVQYHLKDFKSEIMNTEKVMCTQWEKSHGVDLNKVQEFFNSVIDDLNLKNIYLSYIAFLSELPEYYELISEDKIVEGIIKRQNQSNNSERILLLKILKLKKAIPSEALKNHYNDCLLDKDCYWEPDFHIYWNNDLLENFLHSHIFINSKASILEFHSDEWSSSDSIIEIVHSFLVDEYSYNFSLEINEQNFSRWYNTIKYLSISRHPQMISHLQSFLSNETFYPVEDWGNIDSRKIIQNEDKDKAKIIYVRVCDVAYVSLLRALGEIKLNNVFTRNKLNSELFIDEKWRGYNPEANNSVKLKNAYTVLSPNLKMAEKFYYLYDENKELLMDLLNNYWQSKDEK